MPVIASGGAGTPEHFRDAFLEAGASGALPRRCSTTGSSPIPNLKEYLVGMRDRNAPLTAPSSVNLAWEKMDGLLPAIVQDRRIGPGADARLHEPRRARRDVAVGFATFFSRSKQRLWQKGETSGNHLHVHAVFADCDDDALLMLADPEGPTCHTGTISCFGDEAIGRVLAGSPNYRRSSMNARASGDRVSYTRRLLGGAARGLPRRSAKRASRSRSPPYLDTVDGCAEEIADLSLPPCRVRWNGSASAGTEVIAVLR